MIEVELLFGRNIGGKLGVSEAQRRAFLAREVSPRFPDGLTVFDTAGQWRDAKTKALSKHFAKLDIINALIIDGAEIEAGFQNAARNIPNIDVLPIQGINVYDIMRRGKLVLTKAALDALEARFK